MALNKKPPLLRRLFIELKIELEQAVLVLLCPLSQTNLICEAQSLQG
jgi:hypothetical protein